MKSKNLCSFQYILEKFLTIFCIFSLEYHTVYRKYLAQFEAKIEEFIEKVSYIYMYVHVYK
jgi:hypothetical protein